MTVTPESAFENFRKHWENKSPEFHMDDAAVRDRLMSMVSFCMVLIHESPESFGQFMEVMEDTAQRIAPESLKQRVYAHHESTN